MTTDPRAWLERAQNYAKHAWHGPWTWELDDADRVTLHAHGPVPFDLIQADEYRGPTEDIEFITAARTEHPAMAAALTAVLDLHRRVFPGYGVPTDDGAACIHCRTDHGHYFPYPCPTVRAITDHLEKS